MLERKTLHQTIPLTPTRQFTLIVDPESIPLLKVSPHIACLQLIGDLKSTDPPVIIHLLSPEFLASETVQPIYEELKSHVSRIREPNDELSFNLDQNIPKEFRDRLLDNDRESKISLNLLALAEGIKADGILTTTKALIDGRYSIYQYHQIRMVPLPEFADLVEICAHGHSVFWSASHTERYLTFDVFYPIVHWKNSRYTKWFDAHQKTPKNEELSTNLRGALLNRYPFLLYARDMMRFYELQKDFYNRLGLYERFGMAIGYHVTAFYFLLWGMLEQLTIIAKYVRNLKVDEKVCGIRSKSYWDELGPIEPGLKSFIESPIIGKWINTMADMRHTAAHRMLAIPAPFLEETEDSKKSDEEILQTIKNEKSFMYSVLSDEILRA